jgi:hypothetical protein
MMMRLWLSWQRAARTKRAGRHAPRAGHASSALLLPVVAQTAALAWALPMRLSWSRLLSVAVLAAGLAAALTLCGVPLTARARASRPACRSSTSCECGVGS